MTVTRNRVAPLHRRRLAAFVAVGIVASALAACAGGPSTSTAGISCAWPNKTTRDTLNVAYPDTGATYWSMGYNLIAGDQLVIEGTFPEARYMSFITYTVSGNVVDVLTDRDIAASPGTDNPFADPSATAGGDYSVSVSASAGAGTPDNTLATGGVLGSIIYRTYVSDDPSDPTGGVGLPQVSVRRTDGTTVALPTCANPGGDASLVDLVNAFGPPTDVAPTDPPTFRRPAATSGLYANPDNGYVAAVADHQPGTVVVVRATAPVVPDTESGASPADVGADMRYWSMCTNEYRKPYPVTDCVHDTQVPLDAEGAFTIVASTAADRPSNATAADGVAFLDWGSTSTNMLLILRHMLPASGFTGDVFEVAPGQPATPTMGASAPVAVRCPTAVFEAGGAAACGLG